MLADMSMRSVFLASLLNSASNVDRNGLRDMGLLAELERSDWFAGEGKPGEVALLRKGLLEDRLSDSPGDGRRSAGDKVSERLRIVARRASCVVRRASLVAAKLVKRAAIGAGIGLTWH